MPKLRQAGPEWRGRCPVHDGKRESFAVDPTTGRAFCHSECSQGWDIIGLEQALLRIDFPEAKKSVGDILGRVEQKPRIVEEYDYTDETGIEVYFQCVRFEPKDFRQRRRGASGWIWNLKGCRLVLYHLPRVVAADDVWIVEGEKDVHTIDSLGLVGTCNPMGAKKWRPEYSEQLQGKRCFQILDQDEKGIGHGAVVGRALLAAGIEHWLVTLPAGSGKDITNWKQSGGTTEELLRLAESARRFDEDLIVDLEQTAAKLKKPDTESPQRPQEKDPDVETAIAKRDLAGVFQLIPSFARMDSTSVAVLKIRLRQEFGRDFKTREFDEALRAEQLRNRKTSTEGESHLPVILVNNRPMRSVSLDGLAALQRANDVDPQVFVHSGAMVRVMSDETGSVSIRALNHDGLRGCLDRAANWMKSSDRGQHAVPPPLDVVKDIAELPAEQWRLPRLVSVTAFPILRVDGSLLCAPGYDPLSGFYYAPSDDLALPPVPDDLFVDDVAAAVETISDAICDFPFADDAARANYFALLLTPILRPAIAGSVPLCIIEAPSPGSGKSLLVDLASVIITGRPAAMTPLPRHEDEFQKTVGAFLLEGQQMVCFDNVSGRLDSAALALLLTSKEFRARLLGATQVMVAPNLTTWIATGNNINTSDEIARRCYHIRVEYASSNPFLDRDYRHPQLLSWAKHNRAKLFHALLIIARFWFVTGRQQSVKRPLGSFEAWHQLIGSVLDCAAVHGLLENFRSFMASADEDSLQWENFLMRLRDHFSVDEQTAFTIAENPSLAAAQPDSILVMRKRNEALKVSLGRQFSARKGRRYGAQAIYIQPAGQKAKVNVWSIEIAGTVEAQKELF